MADLKLTITGGTPDITIVNGKPETTDGLFNAVFLSLFTPPYWGNAVSGQEERYSSTIPEIMSRPLTATARLDVIAAAKDALSWMIDEGVADEIEVAAELQGSGRLNLAVTISEPSGDSTFAYALNWDAQEVEIA
jgi:phage gp46-like protein